MQGGLQYLSPEEAASWRWVNAFREIADPWILFSQVLLVFFVTVRVVAYFRRHGMIDDRGWARIDIVWVLSSFIAFGILSLTIINQYVLSDYLSAREQYRADTKAVQRQLLRFNRSYCQPWAGDRLPEFEASLPPARRAICERGFLQLNGQLGRNLDQLSDDRDHSFKLERYRDFTVSGFGIGDRAAGEAWEDVNEAANLVNFTAPDLERYADRLWFAEVVKWLRSIWFVAFPIVAAGRFMRSVNDLAKAKAARPDRIPSSPVGSPQSSCYS